MVIGNLNLVNGKFAIQRERCQGKFKTQNAKFFVLLFFFIWNWILTSI